MAAHVCASRMKIDKTTCNVVVAGQAAGSDCKMDLAKLNFGAPAAERDISRSIFSSRRHTGGSPHVRR